jgi:hypothetical protein
VQERAPQIPAAQAIRVRHRVRDQEGGPVVTRPWTNREDAALRRLYLASPVRLIAATLDRSPATVYRRIRALKLAESSPLETLPDAARRYGLTVPCFERWLALSGVVAHASMAHRRRGTRIVLRAEVDRVMAERARVKGWMASGEGRAA